MSIYIVLAGSTPAPCMEVFLSSRSYVPAAGHDRWLSLYDPLTKLLGGPAAQRALIEQAQLRSGQRVLDIGCGTGTLEVMLLERHPGIAMTGLDPDAKALDRARRKCEQAGLAVEFVCGFADSIAAPEASFDCVLSSFMLHHLTLDQQRATLADVLRVLKPAGALHILDFASASGRPRGMIARMLHRDAHLKAHAHAPDVAALLTDTGFEAVRRTSSRTTLFGPIDYHQGLRPASSA